MNFSGVVGTVATLSLVGALANEIVGDNRTPPTPELQRRSAAAQYEPNGGLVNTAGRLMLAGALVTGFNGLASGAVPATTAPSSAPSLQQTTPTAGLNIQPMAPTLTPGGMMG